MKTLNIEIVLMKYIEMKDIYYNINKVINYSMLNSNYLKELHDKKNQFKHYSYSSIYPIEKDKIYKKGKFYTLELKSCNNEIIYEFKNSLKKIIYNDILVYNISEKDKNISYINKLVTITPFVFTKNNRYIDKPNIIYLNKAINKNAIKKYNDFKEKNIDINYSFIKGIEINNKKPIVINYKSGIIIGNKCTLYINNDIKSQDIGKIILGSGIGEKNSLGLGYCKAY